MLQAPSHLSRVCGHGHIKKFWLMQTQKESQAGERKTSLILQPSTASCAGNTVSALGLDRSPRRPPYPVSYGFGDAVASVKHSSLTYAERLSGAPFCKKSPPHLPFSTGAILKPMDRAKGVDDVCRSLEQESQPSSPSPCSYPLNVSFGSERKLDHEFERTMTEAHPAESLHSEGPHKSEDYLSTSAGDSSYSYGGHGHFHPFRNGKDLLKMVDYVHGNDHTKVDDCSGPAQTGMNVRDRLIDGNALPRRTKLPTSPTLEDNILSRRKSHDACTPRYIYNEWQAVNSGLKACTHCGTTKTPMWRCGPQGPKSLCNACGIRFKKYRSSPGQNEVLLHAASPSADHNIRKSLARPLKRKHDSLQFTGELPRPQKVCLKSAVPDVTFMQQNKNQVIVTREKENESKRVERTGSSRWATSGAPACLKKIYGCFPFRSKFKKLAPIDEQHLTLGRMFPQDEEEAALLLMHLSCDLVY